MLHHLLMTAGYILACVIVAFFGRNKKLGFWGYFFGSILLTPVVGILLLFASDERKRRD